MKKIVLFFSLIYIGAVAVFSINAFCSINLSEYVLLNISELSKNYYVCNDEFFSASVTVGTREEDYKINGESNKSIPFIVFSIILKNNYDFVIKDNAEVVLKINNKKLKEKLAVNPINNALMAEFSNEMKETEYIEFEVRIIEDCYYGKLINKSKNWLINSNTALNIATEHFENELKQWVKKFSFKGETFIRIMAKPEEDKDLVFWQVSFVSKNGKDLLIVIDTSDGNVVYSRIKNFD